MRHNSRTCGIRSEDKHKLRQNAVASFRCHKDGDAAERRKQHNQG
nr:MAG TPA: hypothetical protein [Caudoviricetes sp.]